MYLTRVVSSTGDFAGNNISSAESSTIPQSFTTASAREVVTTGVYTYTAYVTVEGVATRSANTSADIIVSHTTDVIATSTLDPTEEELLVVHSVAVASLIISIVVSAGTLAYLFHISRDRTFWKKRMSERLVVYLAVCDLLYSINHLGDHTIALITGELPSGVVCKFFGFFLGTFAGIQSILVLLTALSAFCLMVRERGLSFGRYDWRLLLTAVGAPVAVGTVVAALDMYGPSEVWCMADKSKEYAVVVDLLYAVFMVVGFAVCIFCYGGVWWKIRSTTKLMKEMSKDGGGVSGAKQRSNSRAAKVMCFFVLAFLLQWTAYVIYTSWSFVASPPYWYLSLTVFFCNMGGVFNCFAYTLARKQNNQRGTPPMASSTTGTCQRAGLAKMKEEIQASCQSIGQDSSLTAGSKSVMSSTLSVRCLDNGEVNVANDEDPQMPLKSNYDQDSKVGTALLGVQGMNIPANISCLQETKVSNKPAGMEQIGSLECATTSISMQDTKNTPEITPVQEPERSAQSDSVQEPERSAQTDSVQEPEHSAQSDSVQEPELCGLSESVQEPNSAAESASAQKPRCLSKSQSKQETDSSAKSASVQSSKLASLSDSKCSDNSLHVGEPHICKCPSLTGNQRKSDSVIRCPMVENCACVIDSNDVPGTLNLNDVKFESEYIDSLEADNPGTSSVLCDSHLNNEDRQPDDHAIAGTIKERWDGGTELSNGLSNKYRNPITVGIGQPEDAQLCDRQTPESMIHKSGYFDFRRKGIIQTINEEMIGGCL